MPRTSAAAITRSIGRVQRLCCLGLGSEMLMPDLLREVVGMIPSNRGWFNWAGANLEMTRHYSTAPPVTLDLYLKEFHNSPAEIRVAGGFSRLLCKPSPSDVLNWTQDLLLLDAETLRRTDYYNVMMCPAEYYEQLILRVREAGGPVGALSISRPAGQAPFSLHDRKLLESIAGFVAHAMTRPTLTEDAFTDSDDRALLTAGPDWRLRHASNVARQQLLMALLRPTSCAAEWNRLDEPIPEIAQLCCSLLATTRWQIDQPPPVLRRRNPSGEFVLRAYWLGPTDGAEPTRQIGITIERRVPRALAILRRIEELPLTAREKQLCLLLARDPDRDDLADAMGVGAGTVVTHQRSIYAKLSVHSRAKLVERLQPT